MLLYRAYETEAYQKSIDKVKKASEMLSQDIKQIGFSIDYVTKLEDVKLLPKLKYRIEWFKDNFAKGKGKIIQLKFNDNLWGHGTIIYDMHKGCDYLPRIYLGSKFRKHNFDPELKIFISKEVNGIFLNPKNPLEVKRRKITISLSDVIMNELIKESKNNIVTTTPEDNVLSLVYRHGFQEYEDDHRRIKQ